MSQEEILTVLDLQSTSCAVVRKYQEYDWRSGRVRCGHNEDFRRPEVMPVKEARKQLEQIKGKIGIVGG